MKETKLNKKAIRDYIFPEIETLKALFNQLHFYDSLKTLLFLEQLVELEISKRDKVH